MLRDSDEGVVAARVLHAFYDSVVSEPLPDSWNDLIDRLCGKNYPSVDEQTQTQLE